ncbi:MAG: tetratricopeptide repeat protein [Bdellovibrionales bacterium]|nr:tetratricopeptide repeat protein [Bdellovibrionales bacterium]
MHILRFGRTIPFRGQQVDCLPRTSPAERIDVGRIVAAGLLAFGISGCSKAFQDEMRADMADLRSIQARQTASLDQLQSQFASLQGKVDELEYAVHGKTSELEQRLERFGARVPPPPGVPADLLAEDEEKIRRVSGPAADQFSEGLDLLRAGEFERARSLFQSFVDQNPDTAFSDNALFWTGVSLEKIGKYDRAVVAYSDVFKLYPAEDRVQPALLRLGEAFAKLGSTEEAKLTFQKLLDDYPRGKYASEARKQLRDLNRAGRSRR